MTEWAKMTSKHYELKIFIPGLMASIGYVDLKLLSGNVFISFQQFVSQKTSRCPGSTQSNLTSNLDLCQCSSLLTLYIFLYISLFSCLQATPGNV